MSMSTLHAESAVLKFETWQINTYINIIMKKYWLLQVLQVFHYVQYADYDPSTHSDDDPTKQKLYRALDTCKCIQLL